MVEDAAPVDEKEESSSLFVAFRKLLLASVGAVSMAQEEAVHLVEKMVDRGEIAEKDARKLLDELMSRRKEGTKKAEAEVDKRIDQALNRLNIPTRDDIEALTTKINQLSKKLDEMKKSM
jgi:poly(hydroxyalkanoate) granule-associated protein